METSEAARKSDGVTDATVEAIESELIRRELRPGVLGERLGDPVVREYGLPAGRRRNEVGVDRPDLGVSEDPAD